MPAEGTCNTAERIPFVVSPTKKSGAPATLDGPPELSILSGDGGSIIADPNDSLRGWVQGDVVGDVLFQIKGDGDLGSGVVELIDTILLHVTGENAVNLGTGLGAPEPRP